MIQRVDGQNTCIAILRRNGTRDYFSKYHFCRNHRLWQFRSFFFLLFFSFLGYNLELWFNGDILPPRHSFKDRGLWQKLMFKTFVHLQHNKLLVLETQYYFIIHFQSRSFLIQKKMRQTVEALCSCRFINIQSLTATPKNCYIFLIYAPKDASQNSKINDVKFGVGPSDGFTVNRCSIQLVKPWSLFGKVVNQACDQKMIVTKVFFWQIGHIINTSVRIPQEMSESKEFLGKIPSFRLLSFFRWSWLYSAAC